MSHFSDIEREQLAERARCKNELKRSIEMLLEDKRTFEQQGDTTSEYYVATLRSIVHRTEQWMNIVGFN